MPWFAVEDNDVVPIPYVVKNRFVLFQLSAKLVEIRNIETGAMTYAALLGRQRSQQKPQQRGLARAIRTDNPDLIAPHNRCGKTADNRFSIIAIGDVLSLYHECTGTFSFLDLHAHRAHDLTPFPPGLTHVFQRQHTPFIPGTPGLDALADPYLFLCQLLSKTAC